MKKRIVVLTMAIVMILSCGVVYAFDLFDGYTASDIPEAVKAGDVCETHLLEECSECSENQERGPYGVRCSICDEYMTRCCGSLKVDDNQGRCLVSAHPSGCVNIQDLYWNAYVCTTCHTISSGVASDDDHVEAYYHTKCNHSTRCANDVYCTMPKLSDYLASWASMEDGTAERTVEAREYTYEEAVRAGDYCEEHDIFACDILHELKDD